MNFLNHSELKGRHAVLSPSNYHWLNYDDDKMAQTYLNQLAVKRGTELHALAEQLIRNHVKLPKTKETLNLYVNDAIGFRMRPEQPLVYSDRCFGTADTISFKKNFLRIHDLKTGETPASMKQLEIYAALFCLEYGMSPEKIGMECRIYQSNEVLIHEPDSKDILYTMDTIKRLDSIIAKIETDTKMED